MAIDWTKTQVGQGLIPQEQEALRWLRNFLGGQFSFAGMSNQEVQDWLKLATQLQRDYGGQIDLSGVYKNYIEPILTGRVPADLRDAAMGYLAAQAIASGEIPQALTSYLATGPTTVPGIQNRANLFTQLATAGLFTEPGFQQAFQGFLGQVAPGGRVRGGAPVWEAVATPYYTLKEVAPDIAPQFGEVQFPTTTTGMSRYARQIAEDIARSGLIAQGQYAGPWGFVPETPRQQRQRVRGAFPELVEEWGTKVASTAPASPVDVAVPSATVPYVIAALNEDTGQPKKKAAPGTPVPSVTGGKRLTEEAGVPAGTAGVKLTPEAQRQTVENIKTFLMQNYHNGVEARRALQQDDARLREMLDDTMVQELYNFVDNMAWWK